MQRLAILGGDDFVARGDAGIVAGSLPQTQIVILAKIEQDSFRLHGGQRGIEVGARNPASIQIKNRLFPRRQAQRQQITPACRKLSTAGATAGKDLAPGKTSRSNCFGDRVKYLSGWPY